MAVDPSRQRIYKSF